MAQGRNDGKGGLDGLRNEAQETVQLIIAYIRQETLDPVKGLGRYVLFGVIGAVSLSIGLTVLAVGLLRLLQGETGSTFTGNLSWIPYLIVTVVVAVVAYIAVKAVGRGQLPEGAAAPEATATTPAPSTTPAPTATTPAPNSTTDKEQA